jgi:DNA-binding transcriptional MerR regulator
MRRACLVILLSLIVGCTGLLQNIGARIVTRRFTAEFDLDDTQAEATRASVDRLIAKAPSVIGPRFDFIVASVDRAIAKGLTERDLIGVWRQVDQLLDEVAGHIIDEASPILATLRDEQIDHAHVRFEKRFDEVREKLAEPADERLEKRQDAFAAAIEEWTGDLSPDQEKALRAYVTRFPDDGALQLAADEVKIAEIEKVLRRHQGASPVRDVLWKSWKERGDWGPEARTLAERRAQSRKTLLYVYGLINAKQKDHVSEHLHDLHEKVKRFLGIAGS